METCSEPRKNGTRVGSLVRTLEPAQIRRSLSTGSTRHGGAASEPQRLTSEEVTLARLGAALRWQSLRTPLDAPICLLVLMVPVSLWASFDWRFSLTRAVVLLASVAAFYGLVAYVSSRMRFRTAVASYLTLGLLVAVVCLFGTNWLPKNPLLSRITGHLPSRFVGGPEQREAFTPTRWRACCCCSCQCSGR